MCKDKAIGALVFLISIAAGIAYVYGILFYPGLTLVLLVSLGVAFLLFILAWLGLEMMRTPALEEFEEKLEVIIKRGYGPFFSFFSISQKSVSISRGYKP
jgi:multisubunit Na+/H+ antiporter MnhB subunit